MLHLSLLLLIASLSGGCVFAVVTEPVERGFGRGVPTIESLRITGLETTVRTVDRTVVQDTISLASGYGTSSLAGLTAASVGGSVETSSSVTQVFTPKTSLVVRDLAVLHAENQRAARLVNRDAPVELVLRGQIQRRQDHGWWWSAPLNVITVFGLVLPSTWAEEYTVSLRAYAADGEFLREYTASTVVRSWHHWIGSARRDADVSRRLSGDTVATMKALNAAFADLRAGRLLPTPQAPRFR